MSGMWAMCSAIGSSGKSSAGRGTGGQVAWKASTSKKVEISHRKHLMLSRPAPNVPSDTADKQFLIWKHAEGVYAVAIII